MAARPELSAPARPGPVRSDLIRSDPTRVPRPVGAARSPRTPGPVVRVALCTFTSASAAPDSGSVSRVGFSGSARPSRGAERRPAERAPVVASRGVAGVTKPPARGPSCQKPRPGGPGAGGGARAVEGAPRLPFVSWWLRELFQSPDLRAFP